MTDKVIGLTDQLNINCSSISPNLLMSNLSSTVSLLSNNSSFINSSSHHFGNHHSWRYRRYYSY